MQQNELWKACFGIIVTALSELAAKVTERVLLRLSDDETECDVIWLAV